MVADLGDRRIDIRDRALLLMGYAGAFRRSELVADARPCHEGPFAAARQCLGTARGKVSSRASAAIVSPFCSASARARLIMIGISPAYPPTGTGRKMPSRRSWFRR
jgi:hypothetical protein